MEPANGFNHCVQRTNIQNLKAIHNWRWFLAWLSWIVFKERIYKIWKQFTTEDFRDMIGCGLCSKNEYTKSESNSQPYRFSLHPRRHCVQRTNIQNLKAIHNPRSVNSWVMWIVFKERIYKIWKQFTTCVRYFHACSALCSKNEYTKSESNSQQSSILVLPNSENEYTKSESNSQQDQSLCQFFISAAWLFQLYK